MYRANAITTGKFMSTLKTMFPDRTFSKVQTDFFEHCLNILRTDTDTEKITVLPYRCGIGKSTLLQAYVQASLNNSDYGMIIVTDRVSRLKSLKYYDKAAEDLESDDWDRFYVANGNKICVIHEGNRDIALEEQSYKPILMMTTQRYFQMDSGKLSEFLTFNSNGRVAKRRLIIFDEEPSFCAIHKIQSKEIGIISSSLKDGIDDTCKVEDKQWIISQFDSFAEKLNYALSEVEYSSNRNVYTWYFHDRDSFTDDDTRFFRILNLYERQIRRHDRMVWQYIEDLKLILKNGALLIATKVKAKDSFDRAFLVIKDFRDNFFLDNPNVKVFVLDGTADISPKYSEYTDYVNVVDCSNYNTRLDWMHIHLVDVNTSRNALINKDASDEMKKIIVEFIRDKHLQERDTLLVSYKILMDSGFFNFSNCSKGYFGNLRGYNNYRYCHNYVQIGMNRQRDTYYLTMLLFQMPEYAEYMRNKSEAERVSYIDKLLADDVIREMVNQECCSDTIQNIYRIAARDIDNLQDVNIYLFYDAKYYSLVQCDLQNAFGKYGASIVTEKIPELTIRKIRNRKTCGEKSVAQKIIDWIDCVCDGEVFATKQICDDLGISTKQFHKAKDKNNGLKQMLKIMSVSKGKFRKGYTPVQ